MGTKVIGPIVQSGPGPMQDSSAQCATGWCDEVNGQFCAPPNWGAQSEDKSRSPKMGASKPS